MKTEYAAKTGVCSLSSVLCHILLLTDSLMLIVNLATYGG